MAKKKTRGHKRFKKNPDSGGGGGVKKFFAGIPTAGEVAELAIPAVIAFGASSFATRLVTYQISQRWPGYAKHAGILTAVASVGACWLTLQKVSFLEKYQDGAVLGAIVAAVKNITQLLVPSLGWAFSDPTPALANGGTYAQPQIADAPAPQNLNLPSGFAPVNEDPNLYTYDDRYDAKPQRQAAPSASSSTMSSEDQLLADLEADANSTQGLGSLGG